MKIKETLSDTFTTQRKAIYEFNSAYNIRKISKHGLITQRYKYIYDKNNVLRDIIKTDVFGKTSIYQNICNFHTEQSDDLTSKGFLIGDKDYVVVHYNDDCLECKINNIDYNTINCSSNIISFRNTCHSVEILEDAIKISTMCDNETIPMNNKTKPNLVMIDPMLDYMMYVYDSEKLLLVINTDLKVWCTIGYNNNNASSLSIPYNNTDYYFGYDQMAHNFENINNSIIKIKDNAVASCSHYNYIIKSDDRVIGVPKAREFIIKYFLSQFNIFAPIKLNDIAIANNAIVHDSVYGPRLFLTYQI